MRSFKGTRLSARRPDEIATSETESASEDDCDVIGFAGTVAAAEGMGDEGGSLRGEEALNSV